MIELDSSHPLPDELREEIASFHERSTTEQIQALITQCNDRFAHMEQLTEADAFVRWVLICARYCDRSEFRHLMSNIRNQAVERKLQSWVYHYLLLHRPHRVFWDSDPAYGRTISQNGDRRFMSLMRTRLSRDDFDASLLDGEVADIVLEIARSDEQYHSIANQVLRAMEQE